MPAPTQLGGRQRVQSLSVPSPVGGINSIAPYAAMASNEAIALINLNAGAFGAKTRLGTVLQNFHIGSTQATGTFTPNTAGTATCVIAGVSFNCVFNTNATTTIANLKVLIQANATVMALVSLGGTTTLILTAKQPGALGNTVTTTTNGVSGASWGAATLTGGATVDSPVLSVIPYQGSSTAEDRLFVATTAGIWDCSTFNNAATQVVTFGITTGNAGYCNFTNFTTVAGNYLALCDEANGFYLYEESSHTWNKATAGAGPWQVTGKDPALFNSVVSWQNRLFFTAQASGTGWYLGTGLIVGAATAFPFGNNMKRGGELRCYANWTVDGGAGVENNLAVVSSAGDISVYTGTDPSTVGKFTLVGTWSFAGLPAGRKLLTDSGGDVLILNATGVISLSKLLQGASLNDRSIYETDKIDNVIAAEVVAHSSTLGWALTMSPDEAALIISVPQGDGTFVQYAMDLQTRAWSRREGMNFSAWGIYQNHLYASDASGNLYKVQGGRDAVNFAGTGQPINFFLFTSFQGLDNPSANKRPHLVRPVFLTQSTDLTWITQVRFDYDLSTLTGTPAISAGTSSLWDLATWDGSIWGGDAVPDYALNGVTGVGRMVALLIRGVCSTTSVLNSCDFMYESGGLL